MNKYDDLLKEIPFYKVHPEMIPFVGKYYDKYRILHVGESHYICLNGTNQNVFTLSYFGNRWFTDECKEVKEISKGSYDTRKVVNDFILYGSGRTRSYFGIFSNFLRSFLDSGNFSDKYGEHARNSYNYMAFMNFIQMPSLYSGMSYWPSLIENMKKNPDIPISAEEIWNSSIDYSVRVFDAVVDKLNPRLVVFTSISAGKAYRNKKGKYSDDERVLYLDHPTSSWWNRKKREGFSSREKLEKTLSDILV